MKKILFTFYLILIVSFVMAQGGSDDVIYLKNGSVIKGNIIEYIPHQTIKIQTDDGSIFVYKTEECDSIKGKAKTGIKNESLIPRNNTVPEKFSKKCYYNGIFEINMFVGRSSFDDVYYIKDTSTIILSGLQLINGVQFCKNYFLGVGVGLNLHLRAKVSSTNSLNGMPLYLDFRWYLLNKKAQPYFNTKVGLLFPFLFMNGTIDRYHSFINPSIGIKAPLNLRSYVNLSLGYTILFNKTTLQTQYFDGAPHYTYMDQKVQNNIQGLTLQVGFTF